MMVFEADEDAPWPEWRNWQTRQLEGLVRLIRVQVQVLSPALLTTISSMHFPPQRDRRFL